MMRVRIVSVMLMIAGAAACFVYPALMARLSGEVVARGLVYDRSQGGWTEGWQPAILLLDPARNPMRMTIEGIFLPQSGVFQTPIELVVTIAGGGGVLVEGVFDLPVPPTQPGSRTRTVSVSTPGFDVSDSSDHVVTIRPSGDGERSLDRLEVSVRGAVSFPDARIRLSGVALIVFGAAMFVFAQVREARAQRE